jgi:hypothetical protein
MEHLSVYIHEGCATPEPLIIALTERSSELRRVEIVHMLTLGCADYVRPEYEGHLEMRGGLAFASLVDTSKGLSTVLRFDIHLSRTYRKALDALHFLRRMQDDPTEPPNSSLNGENQLLIGAPKEEE